MALLSVSLASWGGVLQMKGGQSEIQFGESAVFTGTCSAAHGEVRAFQLPAYLLSPDTKEAPFKVLLKNVPPTCIGSAITEPCDPPPLSPSSSPPQAAIRSLLSLHT